MLIGPVRSLVGRMDTLTFGYPVEDSATILLQFESGAHGVVDVNFNVPDEAARNVLEIRGTKGAVLADHTIGQGAGGAMVAYLPEQVGDYDAAQVRMGSVGQPVLVEPVNTYRAQVEHFVDCIERDREPLVGGGQGLHNLRLALLAYESAKTGRVVQP
jgi:predicted dehydrogenase